jgi:nucleoside-specific channel-forming protein
VSNDSYNRPPQKHEIFRNASAFFQRLQAQFKQWHDYEKNITGSRRSTGALHFFSAAQNDKPQYLSDWWHQSVNVVGSYHTRFGPQIRNDTYLEYEAFAKKDWFDFYGYMDAPVFFGGNSTAKVSGTTVPRCLWKSNRVLYR